MILNGWFGGTPILRNLHLSCIQTPWIWETREFNLSRYLLSMLPGYVPNSSFSRLSCTCHPDRVPSASCRMIESTVGVTLQNWCTQVGPTTNDLKTNGLYSVNETGTALFLIHLMLCRQITCSSPIWSLTTNAEGHLQGWLPASYGWNHCQI